MQKTCNFFRLLTLDLTHLDQLLIFCPLLLIKKINCFQALSISLQLRQQSLNSLLQVVYLDLHANQQLGVFALIQVLLSLGVLDSVGRGLQFNRLIRQYLFRSAGLNGAKLATIIKIILFMMIGVIAMEAGSIFRVVGLFLVARRLFLG